MGIDSDFVGFALNLRATTTAPTKGTIVYDKARWRRIGDSMQIRYDYKQSSAGTAGSGTYLFPIPSGYTIDLNKIGDAATYGPSVGHCGAVSWYNNGSAAIWGDLVILVYNSGNLALHSGDSDIGDIYVGSGYWAMSDSASRSFSYHCIVPITGWDI